jgi:hypothetical protein
MVGWAGLSKPEPALSRAWAKAALFTWNIGCEVQTFPSCNTNFLHTGLAWASWWGQIVPTIRAPLYVTVMRVLPSKSNGFSAVSGAMVWSAAMLGAGNGGMSRVWTGNDKYRCFYMNANGCLEDNGQILSKVRFEYFWMNKGWGVGGSFLIRIAWMAVAKQASPSSEPHFGSDQNVW